MKKMLCACVLLLCPMVATAQVMPTVSAEFADPAFDRFVDLAALGDAWNNQDAAALTDAALLLAEGEKVLFRSHNAFTSKDVLAKALTVAADQKDTVTLERLGKIAGASGDSGFATTVAQTTRLSAGSRSIVPSSNIRITDDIEKTNHYYFNMTDLVTRMRNAGDKTGLVTLRGQIKQVKPEGVITQESLDSLVKLTEESEAAIGNVSEAQQQVGNALEKLAGESRSGLRCQGRVGFGWNSQPCNNFMGSALQCSRCGWQRPSFTSPISGTRYTEVDSRLLGKIYVRTCPMTGQKQWRPASAPLNSPWRTGLF